MKNRGRPKLPVIQRLMTLTSGMYEELTYPNIFTPCWPGPKKAKLNGVPMLSIRAVMMLMSGEEELSPLHRLRRVACGIGTCNNPHHWQIVRIRGHWGETAPPIPSIFAQGLAEKEQTETSAAAKLGPGDEQMVEDIKAEIDERGLKTVENAISVLGEIGYKIDLIKLCFAHLLGE